MNLDVSSTMAAPRLVRWRVRLNVRTIIAIAIVIVIAGLALFIRSLINAPAVKPKAMVHSITLLPPPLPPKLEEKPPEPEVKEPIKLPEPAPQAANDTPPAGDLGVDAEGSGAGDGFKLQGRKGGRSLLAAGSPFSGYGNTVQDRLYERLSRDKDIRNANYTVKIKLWFAQDGAVERFELVDTTGNAQLDRSIKAALAEVGRMPAPPEGMPQPMVLRFTGRK